MSQRLFPEIRQVAEQTDHLVDDEQPSTGDQASADEERPLQEIESLCMNCGKNGVTRLLLTSIPFFREVIVMSFECEHCGLKNNEIQSAGTVREYGTVYTVRILSRDDLNRQLVKSSTCSVTIPEIELTIPPAKGQLTTIEGLLGDIVADLSADQPLRRLEQPEAYAKILSILKTVKAVLPADEEDYDESDNDDRTPSTTTINPRLTVTLDDPAGNSFVEFVGSMADPKWNLRTYSRTRKQNIELGLIRADDAEAAAAAPPDSQNKAREGSEITEQGPVDSNEEIYVFPGKCPSCNSSLNTNMKKVNIPYFKDVFIMATNCEKCGYRDNEIKSGSAISVKGKRITLKVKDTDDLSRDVLKSETSGVRIPEIDLVLQPGTLGGRFTTLEGLLDHVYEELSEKVFARGDSVDQDQNTFEEFLSKLKACKAAEMPFTFILEDPLANSYLQNLYAPDPDPNLIIESFDRTWEQNEELGLNDIKVENYSNDVKAS